MWMYTFCVYYTPVSTPIDPNNVPYKLVYAPGVKKATQKFNALYPGNRVLCVAKI